MKTEQKRYFLVEFAFYGVIVLLAWGIGRFLLKYLLPFLAAGLLGWSVQRPARRLRCRLHCTAGACAVGLTVAIYAAIVAVAALLCKGAYSAAQQLLQILPERLETVEGTVSRFAARFSTQLAGEKTVVQAALSKGFSSFLADLTEKISSTLTAFVGHLPALFLGAVVTGIAGCYVAYDFDRFCRFLQGFVPKKYMLRVGYIKQLFVHQTLRIIWGYLRLSAASFAVVAVGFRLLGLPHFILAALGVALVDLLPVLGCGTVLVPWAIFSFCALQYGRGIGMIVIYAVTLIVRNFSEPRIIGKSIGLHPLFTLIALFVGLKVGGIGGMALILLALPTAISYYRNPPQTS